MDLSFNKRLASAYVNPAQRVRVLTESWVKSEVYCPNCGRESLRPYPNNTPVGDFFCPKCREQYELKAKCGRFSSKIVDGEYNTMLRRLRGSEVPNLFALSYDNTGSRVMNLTIVPSHFFVPQIIERRKPLASTARRAGWTGCSILFNRIPQAGRVSLVVEGRQVDKPIVMAAWQRTLFLREQRKIEARGWTLDVMHCVEGLERPEFTLESIYRFEQKLHRLHPGNKHIRAKIRQQLQVLRDAGYLEFLGRGNYRTL